MLSNFRLFLLSCLIATTTYSQNEQSSLLTLGDSAPALRVRGWLKGEPVQQFKKGRVYVLEFWATWCKPCKAAMPHLSALAAQYKDKVDFIGIDIYETKTTSFEKVQAFVDSMGQRMNYRVAAEDSNFIETDWLDASAEKGIPRTFVVNAEGRLAWIGHPKDLAKVLDKVVNKEWNINEALDKRNADRYLRELDDSLHYDLIEYIGDQHKPNHRAKPDSGLLAVNEIIRKEPKLTYTPLIAFYTFYFLLKTDPHSASAYGKLATVTPTYTDPAYDEIIEVIEIYPDELKLPAEIYQLGAEAYQLKIDQVPYPELYNMPKLYNNMAAWYWRAKNKLKAIEAQQKAIDALKSKKDFSKADMVAFGSRLRLYKNSSPKPEISLHHKQ